MTVEEKMTPSAVTASRMPSRVPLVWRSRSFSSSGCSVRVAEKTGTKALAKLPSAKAGADFADEVGAVHAVKMQRRHTLTNQPFTHLRDYVCAKITQGRNVILQGFQTFAQPARDFRAAGVGEAA